jgi:hypothetical protein
MPDRMISASPGPREALERELESARALLQAQRGLEQCLRGGAASEELWACVRRLETAARESAVASRERLARLNGRDSTEAWLRSLPPSESSAISAAISEASRLRLEIRRTARRCEYLARRIGEWTQAQLDALAQWVTRSQSTYEGPGLPHAPRETPSFVERRA